MSRRILSLEEIRDRLRVSTSLMRRVVSALKSAKDYRTWLFDSTSNLEFISVEMNVRLETVQGIASVIYEEGYGFLESITNGSFSSEDNWTASGLWAYNGGTEKFDDTAGQVGSVAQTNNEMEIPVVSSKSYTTVFQVTGRTQGSIFIALGDDNGSARTSNAEFTEILTPTTFGAAIGFVSDSDFDGSIDNVSVKANYGNLNSIPLVHQEVVYPNVNSDIWQRFTGVDTDSGINTITAEPTADSSLTPYAGFNVGDIVEITGGDHSTNRGSFEVIAVPTNGHGLQFSTGISVDATDQDLTVTLVRRELWA